MYRLNYEKKDLGFSYVVAVGVMVVASLILGLIFSVDANGWKFWLMQGLYTALVGSSAVWYAMACKTKFWHATRLNKAPRYAHFLWGCLAVCFLIFCMTPLNNWLMDAIVAMGFKRPSVNLDDSLVGLLIVACVLPCLTEEIVFRGTVAQSLANNSNKLGALTISGALFALFHANPAQTIHQFVLGAFLTLLVYRSGSLWTSIIVHFFNNALVVALTYTPVGADEFWNVQTNTAWVVTLFVVGIVGFGLSVFGYLKTTKSVWQQDEQSQSKLSVASIVCLCVGIATCAILWVSSLLA